MKCQKKKRITPLFFRAIAFMQATNNSVAFVIYVAPIKNSGVQVL